MGSVLRNYLLLLTAAVAVAVLGVYWGLIPWPHAHKTLSSTTATPLLPNPGAAVKLSLPPYPDPDFRQFKWGDSMEQARARSDVELRCCADRNRQPSTDQLFAPVEISGFPATLFLLFNQNKLYRGVYRIEAGVSTTQHLVDLFRELETLLTRKYGPAGDRSSLWVRDRTLYDSFVQHPEKIPAALPDGSVEYINRWKGPNGPVFLHLHAESAAASGSRLLLDLTYETEQAAQIDESRQTEAGTSTSGSGK